MFLIWPHSGEPYLARTTQLRRRLKRLLGRRERLSGWLHLRDVAQRVEYWPYRSRLESSLLLYDLARRHFPQSYSRLLKLRQPAYVKLVLSNPFPRTLVTSRLSGVDSLHYGPFRTRAAAEKFESELLELFQIRRCQEDLLPSVEHPGCVYGEMNKCLRPCQLVVSRSEYQSEVDRLAGFLRSNGRTLLESVRAARDRLSEELEFEEAARMHKRFERVLAMLQGREDLANDITRLCGVAVVESVDPECVLLRFFHGGRWLEAIHFRVNMDGRAASLDQRLREVASSLTFGGRLTLSERQDHLALLAGWYFSSWRDGEWVPYEDLQTLPYRKLVHAVHRVATQKSPVEAGEQH